LRWQLAANDGLYQFVRCAVVGWHDAISLAPLSARCRRSAYSLHPRPPTGTKQSTNYLRKTSSQTNKDSLCCLATVHGTQSSDNLSSASRDRTKSEFGRRCGTLARFRTGSRKFAL